MVPRSAVPSSQTQDVGRALPALARLDGYEIKGVLAQSSFAVIYRAYDPALEMAVAIKEYLPQALAMRRADARVVLRSAAHAEAFEQGLQAFVGETELLARCAHPSLLRVLRLIRRHGTAYRVMHYCPYPTLLTYRQQLGGPIEPRMLRAWFDDLLGALQALHAEGCVHAAVAPGNILLRPDMRPLLLDLDAVRGVLVSERTRSLMAALQPCYEPIEQTAPVSFMVQGPWTDIYSLAATMHFCIDAQPPAPPFAPARLGRFEPLPTVWQRLRAEHPTLAAEPAWLRVLDACLANDPQDRPQSVAEVRALLDAPPAAAAVVEAAPDAAQVEAVAARELPAEMPAELAGQDTMTPPRPGRRRRWPIGAATLLTMTTILAIAAWPVKTSRGPMVQSDPPSPQVAVGSEPSAALPQVSTLAPPIPAAEPPATASGDAQSETGNAWVERRVLAVRSPRQVCGGRERYELLRCMQTQCAKQAWKRHEQCRRLREENRLSG